MADKMKLYWFPGYRSVRNIWLIKEMGVEDDFEMVRHKPNDPDNPQANAAFSREVHPHGTIPALVVPGQPTIMESGAICLYLADRYGKLAPPVTQRSEYYDYIIYGNSTLDEVLEFFYELYFMNVKHSDERQAAMRKKCDACMKVLASRLDGKPWLCGDKLTAADCVVGYGIYVFTLFNGGELLKDHPEVIDYYTRISEREAFKATIAME